MPTFYAGQPDYIAKLNELDSKATTSLTGTITDSLTLSTGTKTFTTDTLLQLHPTSDVKITLDSDTSKYMYGTVLTNNQATGEMSVDVEKAEGVGTFSNWTITSSGATGAAGVDGVADNISVGTVTSGTAAASITGTSPNKFLNLTLQTGATGLIAKGTWNGATAYATTPSVDWVTYAGSSYYRKVAGTTGTDPATDTTNWGLLASKGEAGVDGSIATAALTSALAATGGAALVGTSLTGDIPATTVQSALSQLESKKVSLYHKTSRTVSAGDADYSAYGENILVTNPTGKTGYGVRFSVYKHTGDISNSGNDIGEALISQWNSISAGTGWGKWDVSVSPLPVGSGLSGAPTLTQSFYIVSSESNPQNRFAQPASWQPEARLWGNVVGGNQIVPETQDFSALLGNVRIGYDIVFGTSYSKSPYAANYSGSTEHAKFLNINLVNPNSIAPAGYGWYATGLKDYPTAVAISNAGTGYIVGDLLTFNTGLSQSLNENTRIKVVSTGGGGSITGVEIFVAGSYSQTFAATVGVTGGTGSSATFTYTLSTSAKTPQAWGGIGGKWVVGIDCCNAANPELSAKFNKGFVRIPSGQELARGRNAANTADVILAKFNTSDQLELVGKPIVPRASWTPTFTATSGSFGSVIVVSARCSQINGLLQFQITFQIAAIGTATGSILFTPPVAGLYQSCFNGTNLSSAQLMSCTYNPSGSGLIQCVKYDATSAIADGFFYTVTGIYEV